MPTNAGFFDSPCFSVRKVVPGVPRLARVGPDEADVEAAPEQLDLGLRLVVPVVAPPGPGVAGGRLLRDDHDAATLALLRGPDAVALALGPLERRDGQARLVHHEVVAVEPLMPGGLLALEGGVGVRRRCGRGARRDRCNEDRREAETCSKVSWRFSSSRVMPIPTGPPLWGHAATPAPHPGKRLSHWTGHRPQGQAGGPDGNPGELIIVEPGAM